MSRIPKKSIIIAVAAAQTLGYLGWTSSPIIIGGLIDVLGMTASAAGILVTSELAALAIASWVSAGAVGKYSRRIIGFTGAGLAFLGHALSSLIPPFEVLLLLRILAGIGQGITLAAGNAVAAGSDYPDKIFARVTTLVVFGIALQLFFLPYVTTPFGPAGGYLVLATLTLAVTPAFIFLSSPPNTGGQEIDKVLPNPGLGLLGIVAIGLIAVGQGSVWTFTERIATAAGLDAVAAGGILGAGTLLGIAGASLAVWLGTKHGRTIPITLGTCCIIAAIFILVNVPTSTAFSFGTISFIFIYWFVQPYFFGTLSALDNRGRWAASGGGAQIAGTAIGPAVGGLIVTSVSYAALGWLAIIIGLIGLVAILPVVRFSDSTNDTGQ